MSPRSGISIMPPLMQALPTQAPNIFISWSSNSPPFSNRQRQQRISQRRCTIEPRKIARRSLHHHRPDQKLYRERAGQP